MEISRDSLISSTPPEDHFPTSPPGRKSNSAVNELSLFIEDPRVPEDVRITRRLLIERHPENLRRQVIETIVRLELRAAGIKSSIINGLFAKVPLDGMLWWLNWSYKKSKKSQGGFIIALLNRTGGAYKGRQKGAP
jgi:hypothetical protein